MDLASACLRRIEELNPKLNAFITVTGETALEEARRAENEVRRGEWKGPLHGIPIALKDLIDTAGVKRTAASAVFRDRVPVDDAEIVRRLKAAGAVFLGKLNLHEFAFGGSGGRNVLCSHWDRHGGLNSATGSALRDRWFQADIRDGQCSRRDSTVLVV